MVPLAHADLQWDDNFTWNRARTIAPGQHSWSFRTSQQRSQNRYGGDGSLQNAGQPYGRTWNWGEILAGVTNQSDREQIDSYRQSKTLGLNDIAAMTDFSLKRSETTFELAWAYGLTSAWMIGLALPISMVDTQVQASTALTPGLSTAMHGLSALASEANVRSQVQTAVDRRLTAEGYDQLQSRTQNVIVGDFSLLSQVALVSTSDWVLSLQQLVRIPSAPNGSVADYLRLSRDDGQIDLGLTAMVDHQWHRFLFGAKAGYVTQLPDVQKMRVPYVSNQRLQMVDRSVHRDLGDLVTTTFETFYSVDSRWSLNGAYLGFYKSSDRFSGEDASAAYWQMGDNSSQALHVARGGLSYVIGAPTLRSGVQKKWIANLNVYQTLSGRNVTDGTTGAIELQAYF